MNKPLILSLIKDDLLHSKLLLGLNALGLQTEGYVLQLSETVFALMELPDDESGEQLFEAYLQLRERVTEIEVEELDKGVGELAEDIYEWLTTKHTKGY